MNAIAAAIFAAAIAFKAKRLSLTRKAIRCKCVRSSKHPQPMPNCPRCQQPVKPQALECPNCRMVLKAYGHPGIPLHRTSGDVPLCDSCTYHEDDTCTFPKRPYAKECTLYQDRALKDLYQKQQQKSSPSIRLWLQRNLIWFVLVGLIVVSFILALMR